MIRTRDDLLYALNLAAELEHGLCCQYLYAAYTLKKEASEGLGPRQLRLVSEWRSTLAEIARQEMEHLGFVSNLLTAVGGAPHFWRPNLPQPGHVYGTGLPMVLEPLSPAALERFIHFEKPSDVPGPGGATSDLPAGATNDRTAPAGPVPAPLQWSNLQELYEMIRTAFADVPEWELFIGPPEAQVDSDALGLADGMRVYGVELFGVTNRKEALAAIDRVIEEGEGVARGSHELSPRSHYVRLEDIAAQLEEEQARDPGFEPARPAISSPMTRESRYRGSGRGNLITDPFTWEVAELSNAAYETLLLFLIRYYARTDETEQEAAGLQQMAFFPLMVMAVRPLAEVLSVLAAGPEYPGKTAGPPFEFYREVELLPHRGAAWIVLREKLEEMAATCGALKDDERAPPAVAARLAFMHENFERLVMNFKRLMNLG